ncbi:unnamed protein product [Lactuca virosa]|uniref:Uncharacterized protein n=1 Tax=Lactuca virosa TaxID=75947 RepID=A0AAU9N6C1_9ASTR|nr:unnamed protein product [Lactuca virosa]
MLCHQTLLASLQYLSLIIIWEGFGRQCYFDSVHNKFKEMPRKVSYGVDFDEEYDAYDDYCDEYDYNHGNGIEEHDTECRMQKLVYYRNDLCINTSRNVHVLFFLQECENPLIHAARQGHTSTAKYLIEHGGNPKLSSELGAIALHLVAGIVNNELMEALLSIGVEIDSQSDVGTPLVWVVDHGQQDALKLLLKHKANVRLH